MFLTLKGGRLTVVKTMAKKLILTATKLNQPGGEKKNIFSTKLKVEELIDKTQFKIDFWDPQKKSLKYQGYQRNPTESRARKIAGYIQEEPNPIFPTTILISSRTPLDFKEDKKTKLGTLIINNYPLWIVDGQHRIAGLRYAVEKLGLSEWKKYELPVIILSNFERIEEVTQFYVLNSTQKKVATDLAERLILNLVKEKPGEYDKLVAKGSDWKVRALVVTDLLNERPGSPWEKTIRLPNSPKLATNIINQTSFVKSLQPIFKEGLLSAIFDADKGYEILKNYWCAVVKIFPDAFTVRRDYVIQKTPGVFSLHALAHKIMIRGGKEKTSESDFYSILKKVFAKYDSDFWRADGNGAALYGSMKGFRILANEFIEYLP